MMMKNLNLNQDDHQDDKPGFASKKKNICAGKGYHPALAG